MRKIDVVNTPFKTVKVKVVKKYKKENDLTFIKRKMVNNKSNSDNLKQHFKTIFKNCSVINIIRLQIGEEHGKFCVDGVSGDYKVVNDELHWRQMSLNKTGILKIK